MGDSSVMALDDSSEMALSNPVDKSLNDPTTNAASARTKREPPLPFSPPSTDSLAVLESWCEMCMRRLESAPSDDQFDTILPPLLRALSSVTDYRSLSHHHLLYILFKLLLHSQSIAPSIAELPLPVLLPLFPLVIQSAPLPSLLSLLLTTKWSVSQFLLPLLSIGEEKLDPGIRLTLQRRFPSLLSEARLLCREVQKVVDSKYLALRSYLSSCGETSLSAPTLERIQRIIEQPLLPVDCWVSQRVQSILEEGVPLEDIRQVLGSIEEQEGRYLANYVPTLAEMRSSSLRFGKVVYFASPHVVVPSVRGSTRFLLGRRDPHHRPCRR